MFLAPDGRAWGNSDTNRAFLNAAYAAARLQRPSRPWHALRHTYDSVLANGGIRAEVRDELMGHARQGMTGLYTHLFRDAYKGVEEALHAAFGVNEASTECSVPKVPDENRVAA